MNTLNLLRRYPLVGAALGVGALAGVTAAIVPVATSWLLTIFGGAIAIREVVALVRNFRGGHWGLDILAVSAIGATLVLRDVWAAYVIAVMVVGGEALESYASHRARRQLDSLLRHTPAMAHRLTGGGRVDVPVGEIEIGDLVLVRSGEVVPVDGRLDSPSAEFDESSLTGESLPVRRMQGERLASGIVATDVPIRMTATSTARESQFQQIVAMVDAASSTKGRFIRVADRVAVPFTLFAYALAAAAWAISGDPVRFAQVLVVATPCPLLIAAPTALVAGMGSAARLGIVVKSGDVVERLATVRSVAMDKTGTVTEGKPFVVDVKAVGRWDSAGILAVAAAAEAGSAHVLAGAIVTAAADRGVRPATVTDVREIIGTGVAATWDGHVVIVGRDQRQTGTVAGEMCVSVVVDGEVAGRIFLRDRTRRNAPQVVEELRRLGIERVELLTGDGEATAQRVGHEVGVDGVHAGLKPGDKVALVAAMHGRPVMMVGDGVNDAPVLAAADVGVALGARGSTAAGESADVVLLVDDLGAVPQAVRSARRTIRIARQSIAVGIGLSVALMLVAATGVVPALVGALAQEAVDVVTILNGLRAGSRKAEPTR